MDIFVFRHYIVFMRSATNLIVDSTYDSDISGSGNELRATYRFSITNNFENNGETFVDLSASQYLLVGNGKYVHPNERILLDHKNEIILTLVLRNIYTLKLVQKTNNLVFHSSILFTPSIRPFEGTIVNIDPFDQAFRIDVSYNLHDEYQYRDVGIPISYIHFIFSHQDNGGDIFEVKKPVEIQNINGTEKMQTQFLVSNVDLSGNENSYTSGFENGFTYDINFYLSNEMGDGNVSEAYPPIKPVDLPDIAYILLGNQTLDAENYFDTRMTLYISPPYDFATYNSSTDLSAVHLRATTNEWTKFIALTDYNDISNTLGFTYTWIDPSFVNGTTIEFAAGYESKKGKGGITDTISIYDDKSRWSENVEGIPFGKPNGVTIESVVTGINDIITYTWLPVTEEGLNGCNITDTILYDISLIDANTGLYIPNQYEIDISTNTKTFTGLSSAVYQAIVIQKNTNPNDSQVTIFSVPSKSLISQVGFNPPSFNSPEYHFILAADTGRGEVTIHWNYPETTEYNILNYHISIYGQVLDNVDFSVNHIVDPTQNSYRFTGIPNNHSLNVNLYASNAYSRSSIVTQTIHIVVPPKKLREEDVNLIQGDQEITLQILDSYVDDSLLSMKYFITSYKRQNTSNPYSNEVIVELTNDTSILIKNLENGYTYDFKCILTGNNGNRNHPLVVSRYPIDTITSGTTLFNISRSVDGNSLLFVF